MYKNKRTYRVARKLALPLSQNWPNETKLQRTIYRVRIQHLEFWNAGPWLT